MKSEEEIREALADTNEEMKHCVWSSTREQLTAMYNMLKWVLGD